MSITQIKNKDGTMVWELYMDLRKGSERRPLRKRFDCSARKRKEVERLEELLKQAWKEGWLDQALAEAERPTKSIKFTRNTLFSIFATDWLKHNNNPFKDRSRRVDRLIDFFGERKLGEFVATDRKRYRTNMEQMLSCRGKLFSLKSIREDEIVLNMILNDAAKDDIITHNPLLREKGIPVKKCKPKQFTNWLMPEDLVKFLEAARQLNSTWFLVCLTAYETGARSGELYALHKDDFDDERGIVHIWQSYSHRIKDYKDTKGHDERWQRVTPQLAGLLDGQTRKFPYTPLLFPSVVKRARRSTNSMDVALKRICEKAGVRKITMHGLRHTAATHLAMMGATEEELRSFLGHSETSYIIQTYIHLARRMTNRRIPQLLGEVLSSMWPTDSPEPGKVVTIKPYFVPVEDDTVAEGDQP